MIDLLERLLPLGTQPVDSRDDAVAAFRAVYSDPGVVNGTEMPVADQVGRARSLRQLDAARLALASPRSARRPGAHPSLGQARDRLPGRQAARTR
jgi:hypothetical protein